LRLNKKLKLIVSMMTDARPAVTIATLKKAATNFAAW